MAYSIRYNFLEPRIDGKPDVSRSAKAILPCLPKHSPFLIARSSKAPEKIHGSGFPTPLRTLFLKGRGVSKQTQRYVCSIRAKATRKNFARKFSKKKNRRFGKRKGKNMKQGRRDAEKPTSQRIWGFLMVGALEI